MEKTEKSFRDQLVNMAKVVELLEETFNDPENVKINIDLNEPEFNYISKNLNNTNNEKSIISIGRVDFIFLKK